MAAFCRTDMKSTNNKSANDLWLKQLEQIIRLNLQSPYLSNAFLADQLSLSERQFYRKVKETSGSSPNLYLRQVKLDVAREYLVTKKYKTVSDVAAAVGFLRADYFSNLFEERFGKRPSELLKG